MNLHVVVLAAGKGTRMKSALPKVLHRIAGVPMLEYVLATAKRLEPASVTVVVGHEAKSIRQALVSQPGLTFVVQEPQLGTAHALLMAEPALRDQSGTLILLSGDVPLLSAETLGKLLETHQVGRSGATVLTARVNDPTGYGRIVRDDGLRIARIVEEKDATRAERAIPEINTGIYAFELAGLFDAVRSIASENAQREYYLPDLVSIYRGRGIAVGTEQLDDPREVLGVNSRAELALVGGIVKMTKNQALMAEGVTLEDPATTYVQPAVEVGPDTVIHPGVSLEGHTVIGRGCEIHSGVRIVNSRIGDRTTVLNHCVITDSTVDSDASVGPFAHLRGHAAVGPNARVGNFVELKTTLGRGAKAAHLAYLGDAVVGANANIGAGTITCNYDGTRKHVTTIGEGAFIGSDSQLIAPVTIGDGAYVGTGTTVREDVPAGALAVSAGKQRNIEGWVAERNKRVARHESPATGEK